MRAWVLFKLLNTASCVQPAAAVHLLVACCVVGEVVQQQALRPRLLAQVEQHQLLQLVLPADPSRQSDTRSGGTQDSSDSSNSQQRTCCKQSMQ
jgi:hypothetical protein